MNITFTSCCPPVPRARRSPDDAMNFTFTGLPPVRAPRPTAWAATQGRPGQRHWAPTQGCPYDGPTAHLRAAVPRGSGDDPMKITFTGCRGAAGERKRVRDPFFLRFGRPAGAGRNRKKEMDGVRRLPRARAAWLLTAAPPRGLITAVQSFKFTPMSESRLPPFAFTVPGSRPARRSIPRHAAGLFPVPRPARQA